MIHITIPDDWTPEQAIAVFELIDELRDIIASKYQLQLMEQLRSEREGSDSNNQDAYDHDKPF
jgi:hypothetical protein